MGKNPSFMMPTGRVSVLEEALKPLPEEQREIIANLIAKTYKTEN
ncbi:MAG: hypothetical protein CM15mP124_4200 [Alphaproteobacteria bacterium]|nr:MAG: hypothetical protein CM15mP124_4200 [Alphaproteobacteria bacterium]